jgi:trehalose 6-phosphate phosphatase
VTAGQVVAPVDADRRPVTARLALRRAEPFLGLRPLLIVSDFDGTLSPIVLDPWGARMIVTAQRALRSLAGRPGVHVAILSGRTALDVASRTRIGGAIYLGNHGLERGLLGRRRRASGLAVESDPAAARFTREVDRLADEVARRVDQPWLVVERKPPTVAFHYRAAPDVAEAGRLVAEAVEALDPDAIFVRFPGRRVLELRPPGAASKGDAFRSLLEEIAPRACFVLGDDLSDALAFAELRRAREAGRTTGLALAIQAHAEAPPQVAAAADLVLASPLEAARFLSGLARRVR